MRKIKREGPRDFDTSDTPVEPAGPRSGRRPPPIPVRTQRPSGPPRKLPGANNAPYVRGMKDEGTWGDAGNHAGAPEVDWQVTNRKTGKVYTARATSPADAKRQLIGSDPELRGVNPFDLAADDSPLGGAQGPHHGRISSQGTDDWDDMSNDDPGEPGDARGIKNAIGFTHATLSQRGRDYLGKRRAGPQFGGGKVGRPPAQNTEPLTVAGGGAARARQARGTPSGGTIAGASPTSVSTVRRNSSGVPTTPQSGAYTVVDRQEDSKDPRMEALRSVVRDVVSEVVRKKEGGGGYVLYGPNKGKKKNPKPAGEFPTRLAARRAELARFPPKDPEQLKKKRKRLDKLAKDPKKRADAEKKERQAAAAPKKKGAPVRSRKRKAEGLVNALTRSLQERLFSDEEMPGSHWDDRIYSLGPEAISSDKRLQGFHKAIETASIGALGDAHRSLVRAMRGMAKVHPGDVAFDPARGKTFIPISLDVDGTEVAPVFLYVDGGHVKIEISDEARQAIASLEPEYARDLRGGLMSYQEDHLPEITKAQKAWTDRDSYLDKLHGRLEKQFSDMSGVEHHLARQLVNRRKRR